MYSWGNGDEAYGQYAGNKEPQIVEQLQGMFVSYIAAGFYSSIVLVDNVCNMDMNE